MHFGVIGTVKYLFIFISIMLSTFQNHNLKKIQYTDCNNLVEGVYFSALYNERESERTD